MLVDDEMIDFEAIFGICCNHGSSYKIGFYDNQVAWYCCKRDISCKMVKISNCQLWNFNQERKNDDCQKCWSKTNLMNDTTCVPVNFPRSPNWLSVGFVVTDKSYRAIPEKLVFFCREEYFENIESRLSKFNLQKALQRLGCNFEYPRSQCDSEIEACV